MYAVRILHFSARLFVDHGYRLLEGSGHDVFRERRAMTNNPIRRSQHGNIAMYLIPQRSLFGE